MYLHNQVWLKIEVYGKAEMEWMDVGKDDWHVVIRVMEYCMIYGISCRSQHVLHNYMMLIFLVYLLYIPTLFWVRLSLLIFLSTVIRLKTILVWPWVTPPPPWTPPNLLDTWMQLAIPTYYWADFSQVYIWLYKFYIYKYIYIYICQSHRYLYLSVYGAKPIAGSVAPLKGGGKGVQKWTDLHGNPPWQRRRWHSPQRFGRMPSWSFLPEAIQPTNRGRWSFKRKEGIFFCLKKTRSTVVPLKWHMFGMFWRV